MIHVLLNLVGDAELKINSLTGIFRKCCDEGCLNQHIINVLLEATTLDEFVSITGVSLHGKALYIESLPTEWSRNSSQDTTCSV